MGFWDVLKKVGGAALNIGSSFIPGGSLVKDAAKFGLGLAGGALGAAGKSGSQGSTTTNSNQTTQGTSNTTSNQNTTGNNSNKGFQNVTEDPLFAAFRQSLLPQIGQQLNSLNKPIYGDAQKASYLGSLNDLAKSSSEALNQRLAKSGALDSGRAAAGQTDIEMGRNKSASDFFSQLPFQEQQAKDARFQNVMGLATNFAGRAPLSQTFGSEGTTNQNTTGGSQTTSNQTTNGGSTQQVNGKPFLSNLADAAGAGIGNYLNNQATPQIANPNSNLQTFNPNTGYTGPSPTFDPTGGVDPTGGMGTPNFMPKELPMNQKFFGAGGIVTRPTNAVIGEHGPEMILPLTGDVHQNMLRLIRRFHKGMRS